MLAKSGVTFAILALGAHAHALINRWIANSTYTASQGYYKIRYASRRSVQVHSDVYEIIGKQGEQRDAAGKRSDRRGSGACQVLVKSKSIDWTMSCRESGWRIAGIPRKSGSSIAQRNIFQCRVCTISVVIGAFASPHNHACRAVLPIQHSSSRQNRERRSIGAYKTLPQ